MAMQTLGHLKPHLPRASLQVMTALCRIKTEKMSGRHRGWTGAAQVMEENAMKACQWQARVHATQSQARSVTILHGQLRLRAAQLQLQKTWL